MIVIWSWQITKHFPPAHNKRGTSRDRPKSAPYLRLKNSIGELGTLLWKKFFGKSHNAEKTERGDPLVSPGMVCYAGKQEKPFWFSSLGQIVQFGAIIFCRTFVELFWSVRVDWKKVTIIVAFHFMKRRLKINYAIEWIQKYVQNTKSTYKYQ